MLRSILSLCECALGLRLLQIIDQLLPFIHKGLQLLCLLKRREPAHHRVAMWSRLLNRERGAAGSFSQSIVADMKAQATQSGCERRQKSVPDIRRGEGACARDKHKVQRLLSRHCSCCPPFRASLLFRLASSRSTSPTELLYMMMPLATHLRSRL